MTAARATEVEEEILEASPSVLVTLGDQPLKWFASRYGAHPKLEAYGDSEREYGRLHDVAIGGCRMKLLPLVHPRQAGGLGSHSPKWSRLHRYWAANTAGSLLASIPT
jgi:uracil-DNA glycosylase